MTSLETLSTEATQNCSLIYLIDENLCLGHSYDVMNTNFDSISASQDDLTIYADKWYALYTEFATNSAKWLSALYNISTLSAQWESAYATKQSYKKYWDLPIYLVYPDFVEFTTYYSNSASYETLFDKWITRNFPPDQYIMDQKIDISINLYTVKDFSYSFIRNYTENCTPATGDSATTICCNGCGKGNSGLCNHYWGGDGTAANHTGHSCHWVCDDGACGITVDRRCASYTCHTYSPPQPLHLEYTANFSDRYVTRIISIVYQNDKTKWIKI